MISSKIQESERQNVTYMQESKVSKLNFGLAEYLDSFLFIIPQNLSRYVQSSVILVRYLPARIKQVLIKDLRTKAKFEYPKLLMY